MLDKKEYARNLYLQIVRIMKAKEKRLKENQTLKITLPGYPELEVDQISRIGTDYFAFTGTTHESPDATILLAIEPFPIKIDIIDNKNTLSSKPKKQIGFREYDSTNDDISNI